MLTTKKTKPSIGAEYKEPCHAEVQSKRIKADHVAIAEINKELRNAAKESKIQTAESRLLARKSYSD